MTPISVLVVDDSVVVRRMVTDVLSADPGIRVVGTAPNGKVALAKLDQLAPDIITLDIEMPEMNGIEALRALRVTRPHLPVIMFSTLTAAGASATLDALAAGATDYVTKPSNVGSIAASLEAIRSQLVPRIHALCGPRPAAHPAAIGRATPAARTRTAPPGATRALQPGRSHQAVTVLAIGASTGGPDALNKVLAALPASFPVPVVVVQHMPPLFTRLFAERLDRSCTLRVVEAVDGTVLAPGTVHIAPGDHHLEVIRHGAQVVTRLHTGPPENFCRPAVDVLFRSVARVYGEGVLSVVLTGMGQDGRRGAEEIRSGGGAVLAQDAATSVVWGMPGAVTEAGLADAVLPLGDVSRAVLDRVGHAPAPTPNNAATRAPVGFTAATRAITRSPGSQQPPATLSPIPGQRGAIHSSFLPARTTRKGA